MFKDTSKVLTLYQPPPQTLFQALALHQDSLPVCIDLDFTLLKSSSLYFFFPQALVGIPKFLCTQPWQWSVFKMWLSTHYPLNPKALPYRCFLMDFLKLCQNRGVPLVLATGASSPSAEAIGAYLGYFHLIISSTLTLHCVGEHKAQALVDHYGKGKFHYFGDSHQDLLVWKQAHSVVALNPSYGLSREIQTLCVGKPCIFLYDGLK